MDKRRFHYFLNNLKDENSKYFGLIESIQNSFETTFESITEEQKKSLIQYPIQYIERIPEDKGEWTTQIHVWAEQQVPEILKLDPMILAFKNSYGDSVLMCLTIGATGAYTDKTNYKLIQEMLNTDFSYEEYEKDSDGKDIIVTKNALSEVDLNNQTVIDFLIDYAFATGKYEGHIPDPKLQKILKDFCGECSEY